MRKYLILFILLLFMGANLLSQDTINAKTCVINPVYTKNDTVIIGDLHDYLESVGFCSWLCNSNIDINIINPSDQINLPDSVNLNRLMDYGFKAYAFSIAESTPENFSISIEYKDTDYTSDSIFLIHRTETKLTRLLFYNGFVKNKIIWRENSRVKSLKLTIDEDFIYILSFSDTDIAQLFDLPKSIILDQKHILKFELLESYDGLINKTVFITEIFFDGTNGHSFLDGNMYIWE